MPVALDGRGIVVTGGGEPLADGLASALAASGAAVVELAADVDLSTPDRARSALDGAVRRLGRLDAVVHAAVVPLAVQAIGLVAVDDDRWEEVWEGTMRSTLFLLQAAHAHLAGGGGRIVLVTPTVSQSGAAGLVPLAAAVEGQRSLAKSAARQWGPDGITVNCIAPSATLVGVDAGSLGEVALAAPALGGPGDAEADLGPVVAFLCSEASHHLTGATLTVDGGTWMGL